MGTPLDGSGPTFSGLVIAEDCAAWRATARTTLAAPGPIEHHGAGAVDQSKSWRMARYDRNGLKDRDE